MTDERLAELRALLAREHPDDKREARELIAEVDRLRETHRVTLSSLAEAKEALDKVASGAVTLGQCPHAWGACRLGCLSPYICRSFVEEAPDAADLRVKSAALTAELRAAGSAIEKADAFEAALDEEIEKALGNRDMYAVDEQRDALLDSVRARLGLDPLHKESDRD